MFGLAQRVVSTYSKPLNATTQKLKFAVRAFAFTSPITAFKGGLRLPPQKNKINLYFVVKSESKFK